MNFCFLFNQFLPLIVSFLDAIASLDWGYNNDLLHEDNQGFGHVQF